METFLKGVLVYAWELVMRHFDTSGNNTSGNVASGETTS